MKIETQQDSPLNTLWNTCSLVFKGIYYYIYTIIDLLAPSIITSWLIPRGYLFPSHRELALTHLIDFRDLLWKGEHQFTWLNLINDTQQIPINLSIFIFQGYGGLTGLD